MQCPNQVDTALGDPQMQWAAAESPMASCEHKPQVPHKVPASAATK